MYTYSIQNAKPSGETFAIEWDGDDIHGLCGPLDPLEKEQAIRDIKDAGSFDYDTDVDGIGDTPDDWGFPLAAYDPNTGEVYRA